MTDAPAGSSQLDRDFMAQAIALAKSAGRQVRPNPPVGCVLVRNGEVIGRGAHLECGGPHAEVHALREAGVAARGSTAYVTLEPCAHYGRTPPCVEALIAAGVERVVIALRDPNPVAQGGIAKLHDAGIEVVSGVLADAAAEVTEVFLVNSEHNRPHVTLKMAASMDGFTAASDGSSQWITGELARQQVHRMRSEVDAVLVGSGTVLADNPRLVPYLIDSDFRALRVVFDRRLRLPIDSALADCSHAQTLVCTDAQCDPARMQALIDRGVQCWLSDEASLSADAWLNAALTQLYRRGVCSILCEGGATLAAALLRNHLVDKIELFSAPILLGQGRALWPALGIDSLSNAQPWRWGTARKLGADIWMTARPSRRSLEM
ncbi:MAG TPA: bifunctional diaminohydroxyphosphoribosylaminopyrimidine deaminase/5-amino-6-(5-phosphoribosylamino)uracil reductase RibD [Myxococcales bacterium]|nr:riboflavin biosynthesis protein RibD [Myxococcales bacterium]HAN31404.1 bifunctional diaminohydroxyphosphoribosylaminopyrimidine deaminase/5-amino-6-(5-phosphoribosylamino)uracil reductase RibD [Myxococcales bacterium]